MARPHRCDVPGCTRTRRRWQRLCERCWAALPGDIRTAILESHKDGRKADWRRECRRAAEHMADAFSTSSVREACPRPRSGERSRDTRPLTTPQQAYAAQQRLLGEHD